MEPKAETQFLDAYATLMLMIDTLNKREAISVSEANDMYLQMDRLMSAVFTAEPPACDHPEWEMTEAGRVCMVCGKNLDNGVDPSRLADLEEEYRRRRDAEADHFVPDEN